MNKYFLFFICFIIGFTYANAQETKNLFVKKIMCTASLQSEAVPSLLDENGIEFQSIDVVNWKEFPYKPEVSFRIAHTGNNILLQYKVKEASIRAVADTDNGRVWEDSCVEFFVSPSADNNYYNFECNCIGKLLIQAGVPGNRKMADAPILNSVKRWSSLGNEPFEEKVGESSWEVAMIIPVTAFFRHSVELLDGQTMKGNFYKCGDELKTPHFLSWNPIKLERPKFHAPAYFGTLIFE